MSPKMLYTQAELQKLKEDILFEAGLDEATLRARINSGQASTSEVNYVVQLNKIMFLQAVVGK